MRVSHHSICRLIFKHQLEAFAGALDEIDINQEVSAEGLSALQVTVREGQLAMVLQCLEHGADFSKNSSPQSPLDIAISGEHWVIAQLLLLCGADPKAASLGGGVNSRRHQEAVSSLRAWIALVLAEKKLHVLGRILHYIASLNEREQVPFFEGLSECYAAALSYRIDFRVWLPSLRFAAITSTARPPLYYLMKNNIWSVENLKQILRQGAVSNKEVNLTLTYLYVESDFLHHELLRYACHGNSRYEAQTLEAASIWPKESTTKILSDIVDRPAYFCVHYMDVLSTKLGEYLQHAWEQQAWLALIRLCQWADREAVIVALLQQSNPLLLPLAMGLCQTSLHCSRVFFAPELLHHFFGMAAMLRHAFYLENSVQVSHAVRELGEAEVARQFILFQEEVNCIKLRYRRSEWSQPLSSLMQPYQALLEAKSLTPGEHRGLFFFDRWAMSVGLATELDMGDYSVLAEEARVYDESIQNVEDLMKTSAYWWSIVLDRASKWIFAIGVAVFVIGYVNFYRAPRDVVHHFHGNSTGVDAEHYDDDWLPVQSALNVSAFLWFVAAGLGVVVLILQQCLLPFVRPDKEKLLAPLRSLAISFQSDNGFFDKDNVLVLKKAPALIAALKEEKQERAQYYQKKYQLAPRMFSSESGEADEGVEESKGKKTKKRFSRLQEKLLPGGSPYEAVSMTSSS